MEEQKGSEEGRGMEDLKYLVIDALDKNGSLDAIRAQLRSCIFGSIQSEQAKAGVSVSDPQKAFATPEGQAAALIFQDFCQAFDMQHSLNVFLPECKHSNSSSKSVILEEAGLQPQGNQLLVYQLLRAVRGRESIAEEIDYEEDFEESSEAPAQRESFQIGESVGSSLGVDASVDSTALENYDVVERVRRIN